MRKFLISLCFLFAILAPSLIIAQENPKKITHLTSGEKAPFTGVLLSHEAFADLKVKADQNKEEIKLKVSYEVKKANLESQLEIAKLQEELRFIQQKSSLQLQMRDDRIKYLEEVAFEETNWFQRNSNQLSFLGGALFTIGSIWLLDSVGDKLKE